MDLAAPAPTSRHRRYATSVRDHRCQVLCDWERQFPCKRKAYASCTTTKSISVPLRSFFRVEASGIDRRGRASGFNSPRQFLPLHAARPVHSYTTSLTTFNQMLQSWSHSANRGRLVHGSAAVALLLQFVALGCRTASTESNNSLRASSIALVKVKMVFQSMYDERG